MSMSHHLKETRVSDSIPSVNTNKRNGFNRGSEVVRHGSGPSVSWKAEPIGELEAAEIGCALLTGGLAAAWPRITQVGGAVPEAWMRATSTRQDAGCWPSDILCEAQHLGAKMKPGYGEKGFNPCFHLPGVHFRYFFLTLTHVAFFRVSFRKLADQFISDSDCQVFNLNLCPENVWAERTVEVALPRSNGMACPKVAPEFDGSRIRILALALVALAACGRVLSCQISH